MRVTLWEASSKIQLVITYMLKIRPYHMMKLLEEFFNIMICVKEEKCLILKRIRERLYLLRLTGK